MITVFFSSFSFLPSQYINAWDLCINFLNTYFRRKQIGKNISLFCSIYLPIVFAKKLNTAFVFEKKANIYAENWQKWQKIVIITLTRVQLHEIARLDAKTYFMYTGSIFLASKVSQTN
jgi:hypothetical protein